MSTLCISEGDIGLMDRWSRSFERGFELFADEGDGDDIIVV